MQIVNTLKRVTGRRGFLLAGITAALSLHAGCGNPITYARLSDGAGGGVAATVDGSADLPAGSDGPGTGGAAGLGGISGSGGAGTAGATGAGGRGPGTGGSTGVDGGNPGTGGATGTAGATGTGGNPGTGGTTGTGGTVGVGGRIGTDGGTGTGGSGDVAQYNFETSSQGWGSSGNWTGIGPTTAQHFAGQSSFGGTLNYTPVAAPEGTTFELGIQFPPAPVPVAGNTVIFHVFLPLSAGGLVRWIQPYLQDSTTPVRLFPSAYKDSFLTFGGWNTLTVPIPAGFLQPTYKVAVQFNVAGAVAYSGGVYVDAISW